MFGAFSVLEYLPIMTFKFCDILTSAFYPVEPCEVFFAILKLLVLCILHLNYPSLRNARKYNLKA